MGSRMKEDEKNERIIRGLLKQPYNRKCINCNLLGPQYMCTTFSTFVCPTCSGIHREFTHRVKSISMAKFTPQEVAALQAGGNEMTECAREIYFKEWEPQRNSAPDSSNVDRLRDFIKHVYVHRRYAGERSVDRPPRVELGDKEDPNDSRRSDGYRSSSRSPPYDDTRASPGYDVRRSPGYDQYNQRHNDYGKSPIRAGVVNDWRREDRFANGRKSEDRCSSDGDSRSDPRSPDHQNDSSMPSPPVVRPVRDMLGDNITPSRISKPPASNGGKTADGPTFAQRTTSSSSLASSNSNPTEPIKETSLIDFDAEPEPSLTAATTQTRPSTSSVPSNDNWTCFDKVPENKVSQPFLNSNSSESVLTQLSVPAPAPICGAVNSSVAPAPLDDLFSLSSGSDASIASAGNATTAAFAGAPATASSAGAPTVLPVNGGTVQWSAMQQDQLSFLHGSATQPAAQPLPSSFASGPNNHSLTGDPSSQGSQVANSSAQTEEMKSKGSKELPVDLFTATYLNAPYKALGWQDGGLVPGMGYQMHFNSAMAMPTFPQPSLSANPFDVNSESSSIQAAAFPSMSSLHSALPNTTASGGLPPGPNLGNHAMPSWIPSQSSPYQSTAQSFAATMPGAYMGQELPNNIVSPRSDGFGGFSNGGIGMSSLNPAASLGGNPFG